MWNQSGVSKSSNTLRPIFPQVYYVKTSSKFYMSIIRYIRQCTLQWCIRGTWLWIRNTKKKQNLIELFSVIVQIIYWIEIEIEKRKDFSEEKKTKNILWCLLVRMLISFSNECQVLEGNFQKPRSLMLPVWYG